MATIRIYKAVKTSTGYVTGLTPTLTPYQIDGTALAPIAMTAIPNTGVYYADVTTEVPLIGNFDAGAAVTNSDDRYDRLLIHPDAEAVTVVESPAGTYNITLVTKDDQDNPIPNVNIKVLNEAGQTVRTVQTDSNGEVVIAQDAGTYTAVPYKAMVNIDSVAYTVSGVATVNIVGEVISPSEPQAGIQTVYGNITRSDGGSPAGCTLEVVVQTIPQAISNQLISSQILETTLTSSYFELAIIKGAVVTIIGKIPDGGVFFRKSITISSDNTKNLGAYL